MTTVEFSTAALADAIKKGNTVAPTRGAELDKFRGFVFDVDPDTESVVLRVTNGEVFYTEVIYPKKIVGKKARWRVSSKLMFDIVTNLKVDATAVVTLDDSERSKIRLKSKGLTASAPFIRGDDYPHWDLLDTSEMTVVTGFAAALDHVSWSAASDNIPPRCGVQITSEFVAAASLGISCMVPFEFELNGVESVCVPHNKILPIARMFDELRIGATGNWIVLSPTDDIVIKCALWDSEAFPNVKPVFERADSDTVVFFNKEEALSAMRLVDAVGSTDRQKALDVLVGGGNLTFQIRDPSSEEESAVTVFASGSIDEHDEVKFLMSLDYMRDAVSNAPGKDIVMQYDPDNPLKPVKVTGQDGYAAVILPRRPPKTSAAKEE